MSPSPAIPALDLGGALEERITALWRVLSLEVPSGLSRTAASVLAVLHNAGPQRVTTLAAHEHVAQPSMSVLLQRLERRGLIERTADPADRRACRVAITAAGDAVLAECAEARARWLRARVDRLGDEERRALTDALAHLDSLLNNPEEDVHER